MKRLFQSVSVLLATFAIGCGPAGHEFHGEYTGSGTATYNLTGVGSRTGQLSVSYRISEGATSDLVISETTGKCSMPADVEGSVATIRAGTVCTQEANGVTVTRTITNGVATLTGKSIQLNISGNVTAVEDGQTYPGTFFQGASLTQIAK